MINILTIYKSYAIISITFLVVCKFIKLWLTEALKWTIIYSRRTFVR